MNKLGNVHSLVLLLCVLVAGNGLAQVEVHRTEYQPVRIQTVAENLAHPWSIDFLPDGRMLVTERTGQLNLIDSDGSITVIDGTPEVAAQRQGGLLEVLVHPNFEDNGWVYLTYAKADASGMTATALARGRLDGDRLVDVQDIYVQERFSDPGRHYGSKLAWLPDGTLLMSIGDRGSEPPRAQAMNDSAGKLLRLTEDGSVPPDNPFVGRDDVLPEIFTLGNRNIQGLMVHPETGQIWSSEHGPRGGDELNLMTAGANYGWPVVSRGRDYRTEEQFGDSVRSHPDMVEPVIDWTPSLAASGLAVLVDDHFPAWQGNFLAGGLRTEQIRRVVFENGEPVYQEELLRGKMGRVRDIRVGPDGNIYVATDSPSGAVYRISPAG
ncbi:MAG: PQQ-dependent sugar dehydrogenase [Wenzhouxiangella sp.]|jgi:glucose/arabinose dehydrogenase|nr:PQQ-dependent sugar dehydrogenase [Wenzhouxiangella sp.]